MGGGRTWRFDCMHQLKVFFSVTRLLQLSENDLTALTGGKVTSF